MLPILYSFYGCFLKGDFVNKDTGGIRRDQDRDGFSIEDGDCETWSRQPILKQQI